MDGQRTGQLFYGSSGRTALPWSSSSSSYLCVRPPIQRVSAASTGGTGGACDGSLVLNLRNWLAAHSSALGQPIAVGQAINVQAWARDPLAPGASMLSDALELEWGP